MIKQDPNKQIVAWFKIAEFVSRGEKERALALYRLLAHAINDSAFAQQLEGDILLSFHDENAFLKYAGSARLYLKENRMSEACAVFEHLLALSPVAPEQLQLLIDLYKAFPQQPRTTEALHSYIRLLINQKAFEQASQLLQQVGTEARLVTEFGVAHQELVTAWVHQENVPTEPLRAHVRSAIDYYGQVEAKPLQQQKALQTFLMTLKLLHANLYEDACLYLAEANLNAR